MGLVRVVVIDEDVEHVLEVAAVEDQEPVEAFSAGGADEALGDRVRAWRPDRRLDDSDVDGGEDGVEGRGELGVPVSDEEPEAAAGRRRGP
jgi:hypothetical protein